MEIRRKNNRGSALLLVIIAVCFIAILGSLILSLTMTNIQMKHIDYQAKENFYETEAVLEELHAGLEELSSDCLYQAYNYILLHYSDITQDTNSSVKSEFDSHYISQLVTALCGQAYAPASVTAYYYKPEVLKGFLNSSRNPDDTILYGNTETSTNTLKIKLDISDPDKVNSVTLQKVKISFENSKGYETRITTDICLTAPNLNFSSASIYPEFTKYALIADRQLLVDGGTGISIDGNLYAGAEGVKVSAANVTMPNPNDPAGYNLKINGDTLITRGNLIVDHFAKLFIGDRAAGKRMNVWAENIATTGNEGSAQRAYLNIYGNCKVADDLMLGAENSDVTIGGSYYGYNYNKTNQKVDDSEIHSLVNSNYSSAILINGRSSSLDMSGLASLTVAGRAFVSRRNQAGATVADDIMTGESISVKSDQLAYLVPDEYLWWGHNPVMGSELGKLPEGQKAVLVPAGALADLLTNRQYVEYHYLMGGTVPMVYYYLEFKDQAAANKYFREYYHNSENKEKLDVNSGSYLYGNGIKLSGALLLAANGLVTGEDGKLALAGGVLSDPDSPDPSLLSDAIRTAREYKSRQLCLVAASSGGNTGDFRLDKTTSPLFKAIISQEGSQSVIEKETSEDSTALSNGFVKDNGSYYKKIPIDMGGDGFAEYSVYIIRNERGITTDDIIRAAASELSNGIIITTGDLTVKANYKGMIISGGRILLSNSGVQITSAPEMVQSILSYALEKEKTEASAGGWHGMATRQFTHYFTDYAGNGYGSGKNIDEIKIAEYITYENWKKNER
ncbi:hypothetical protein SAMN02745136_00555 [Anaerocolumna jejuensis DSM 15929]|uniref:PilX N-terminal n=1 Tax=Anaerocolumna jejuensis DSM 15929 TaxID=1121322 RepID=A0A1M6KRI2_9FIRM|nr:hypothetical protein [Anaerocolumna jejuensis]SHJ61578.1 hypothetical protein SAMN02745136_00555 [Anaerocolumna jejuensis DSM 15929]